MGLRSSAPIALAGVVLALGSASLAAQQLPSIGPRKGIIVDTLARVRLTIPEHLADPDRDQYRLLLHYRDKMLYMKRHADSPALALYDKFGVRGAVIDAAAGSYREQIKRMDVVHENERRFIRHKVKFAMGTDSGSFFNFLQDAPAATEMGYMVEMGMTPMEAMKRVAFVIKDGIRFK